MGIPTQAVKAVIESEGKILLLQRSKKLRGEDNWDLPGGLIENNQTQEETLKREIAEELGLNIDIIRPFGTWNFRRALDGKIVSVQNYLCKIPDNNFEIKLSEEHSVYKWISPKDISNFRLKDPSLVESIIDFPLE
jgi:8-oxo-dGTP diphosphatase